MMINYILDTSILSLYFIGKDPAFTVVNNLNVNEIAITTTSVAEMYFGYYKQSKGRKRSVEKDENIKLMTDNLHTFSLLPIDALVAHEFAKLKTQYAPETCRPDADLWIVASSNIHNATILTTDRDFLEYTDNVQVLSIGS